MHLLGVREQLERGRAAQVLDDGARDPDLRLLQPLADVRNDLLVARLLLTVLLLLLTVLLLLLLTVLLLLLLTVLLRLMMMIVVRLLLLAMILRLLVVLLLVIEVLLIRRPVLHAYCAQTRPCDRWLQTRLHRGQEEHARAGEVGSQEELRGERRPEVPRVQ